VNDLDAFHIQTLNASINALVAVQAMLADPLHVEQIERAAAGHIRSDATVKAALESVSMRVGWLLDGYRSQLPADTSATRPTPHAAVAIAALTPDDPSLPGEVPPW
jgi:hypothetical protein